MYTSGMIQGAAAQRQAAFAPSQNISRYSKRQKDAQLVTINSQRSEIEVALPFLEGNYTRIGDQLDQQPDQIFYQVQSMRYKNNFFNLFPNATLNFLVDVLYKPFNEGDSTFEALGIETESSNSWVEVNLNPTNEYLQVSVIELVQRLNARLIDKTLTMRLMHESAQNYFGTFATNHINFQNMFRYAEFGITSEQRITLKFVTGEDIDQLPVVWTPPGVEDEFPIDLELSPRYIGGVRVSVQTSNANTAFQQSLLARMLGFTESIEYGIDLAVRNPFTVYTPGVYPQAMFDLLNNGWENIYSMDAKQFWKEQLTAVPQTVLDVIASPLSIITESKAIPNLTMYDKILVRSSLTTNIWENDGRRRNVIATIPIVAGEGNGGIIEYVPPGGEVRTYSIKDSLASAKNFKINFTDELNQPIVFNSPYELTIAIFFCSGESSVNMY